MAGELLRLRFQRGEVVVELEGDARSVRAELDTLVAEGYGRLLDFFAGAGSATETVPVEEPDRPHEEAAFELLTNPARTLTFAVDRLDVLSEIAAIDLDGDGVPENIWAILMSGLRQGLGFDPQGAVDRALAGMAPVLLFQVSTPSNDLAAEQRADVSVRTGRPVDPDRTSFQLDTTQPAVTLPGMLRGGRFVSQEPRRGSVVTSLALPLPAFPAAGAFVLPVRAPRLSFNLPPDGSSLTQGRLNGGVRRVDAAPAIAAELTAQLAADPQSPARAYDTGNCSNADGTSAQAGDGVIDPCEVLSNELFRALMTSDVHLFDNDTGHYDPDPNGIGDSVSFGVAFTAARASF